MAEVPDSGIRVTKVLRRAEADPAALEELERFRQTLVVMFSDIQGSTAYFEKHGDTAGLFLVHECNKAIRSEVEKHGGTVIKTIGDGTMMTFQEPKEAVEAAIAIQAAMVEIAAGRPESDRVALRIGIHYGSGIVRSNDVFGDVVNVASRVESVASPGQVLLSEELYFQVRESGFAINEFGRFKLKGKTGERTLFQVRWRQGHGAVTEGGTVAGPSVLASRNFKLQLINKDGSCGTEYPVQDELGIGVTRDHNLIVSTDLNASDLSARVFVQDQVLFVREQGNAGNDIYLRLAASYVLERDDLFQAGRQVFRYEEKVEPVSLTAATAAHGDAALPARNAGELVRIDDLGKPVERYPLTASQVQFGRSRGSYVFPDDKQMSRAHFVISHRGEDFLLEDTGSRNGTCVQVRRKTVLSPGSALLIGGHILRVTR